MVSLRKLKILFVGGRFLLVVHNCVSDVGWCKLTDEWVTVSRVWSMKMELVNIPCGYKNQTKNELHSKHFKTARLFSIFDHLSWMMSRLFFPSSRIGR